MQLNVLMARFNIDRKARCCWFINVSDGRPEGEDSRNNYRSVTSSHRLVLIRVTPSTSTWGNAQRFTIFKFQKARNYQSKFQSHDYHSSYLTSIIIDLTSLIWLLKLLNDNRLKENEVDGGFDPFIIKHRTHQRGINFIFDQIKETTELRKWFELNLIKMELGKPNVDRNDSSYHFDVQFYLQFKAFCWLSTEKIIIHSFQLKLNNSIEFNR